MKTTEEVGVTCSKCGAQRAKKCKPWKICRKCEKVFCLRCMNGNATVDVCWSCWNQEYNAAEAERKRTPVECLACHKMKLPGEMSNEHAKPPTICKECDGIAKAVEGIRGRERRIREAKPGLVEVVYGVIDPPLEDGGSGYAYRFNQPLALGDIVLVPATWLDDVHQERGPKEATVVSTYSSYDGPVSEIIHLVRRAKSV